MDVDIDVFALKLVLKRVDHFHYMAYQVRSKCFFKPKPIHLYLHAMDLILIIEFHAFSWLFNCYYYLDSISCLFVIFSDLLNHLIVHFLS